MMTEKQKEIAETFFKNAKNISFGTVAVELKIHEGRCVGVTYTISEKSRKKENGDETFE
jgi:hypothetical protein